MARKKVKVSYMENPSARRSTYRKRVPGLLKKAEQLSSLCDVDTCAIMYGEGNQPPVTWPQSELEVGRIIAKYKAKSQVDQAQWRMDQKSFLEHSIKRETEKIKKIQAKNRELQMENLITDVMSGKSTLQQVLPTDLGDFIMVIEAKMRAFDSEITKRESTNNYNNLLSPPPPPPSLPPPPPPPPSSPPPSPPPMIPHANQDGDNELMEAVRGFMR